MEKKVCFRDDTENWSKIHAFCTFHLLSLILFYFTNGIFACFFSPLFLPGNRDVFPAGLCHRIQLSLYNTFPSHGVFLLASTNFRSVGNVLGCKTTCYLCIIITEIHKRSLCFPLSIWNHEL